MRAVQENFAQKVVCVRGDCSKNDLGLSEGDKRHLADEVNCVFHCAGLINFDEKLRLASHVNVRATKDLLSLARCMKNLKVCSLP